MATLSQHPAAKVPAGTVPEQMPIQLDRLSHNYGDRLALDDLSFAVQPAEIFGLLGPNGSGKTTLFRILSTLMVPSGGTARIQGFDVAREPNQARQQTGIVFQARSLDLKLTVAENLKHQGHLYGLRGETLKRRSEEVLRRVGLSDRAREFVETLSGGMQRRVELAKGLIHSPAVLLLDEPSTGLDPGARRDMWQYLRSLRDQEGVSILVTTHLMEEAEHCDRLAILNQGNLVALGSPAQLKSAIGGDVVLFETASPEAARSLAERMATRFAVQPSLLGSTVRLERPEGHRLVTAVVEAFPGEIDGISVARPSLEDVFIQRTGHRFWEDAPALEREKEEPDGNPSRNRPARAPNRVPRHLAAGLFPVAARAGPFLSPEGTGGGRDRLAADLLGGPGRGLRPQLPDRRWQWKLCALPGLFFPWFGSHDRALYRHLQHDVADPGPQRGFSAVGAGGPGQPLVHCSGQSAGRRDAGGGARDHLPRLRASGWECA